VLFLLITLGRGFGPYWDSWNYYYPSEKFSQWLSAWWDGGKVPPMTDWRYYFPEEPSHPPLMEWGAAFSHALFRRTLGNLGACRLFIEVFAALWCSAAYLFLTPRVGRRLALLGVVLFAASPRFWVHAVLLNIDGLMASVYGLAILTFFWWQHGWKGKVAAFAMLFLAFLTKLQAIYLIPLLLAWVGSVAWVSPPDGRSRLAHLARELILASAIVLLAGLTVFSVWPALWLDFPKGLETYIAFISRHMNVPVLYFGTLYKGLDHPPWHYPWVFSAIALPPAFLLPMLIRLFRLGWGTVRGKHGLMGREEWLLWGAMLVPLAVSSLPQAPKYDEVRLLLPAYGPLGLLSALEIGAWWKWAESKWLASLSGGVRHAMLACLGFFILLPAIRIYPFNLVYYSPLIGGVSGACQRGFDLEYLGVSMHRLNPKLQQVAKAGDILLLAGCNALVFEEGKEGWPAVPQGIMAIDFKLIREIDFRGRSVFAIISSRYGDLGREALLVIEKVPALDTVSYGGERLFSLHRITPAFVESLPKELKK
jgi:4-amino-4-deoxy-L-arabinose transferase-like glycosyltransferase